MSHRTYLTAASLAAVLLSALQTLGADRPAAAKQQACSTDLPASTARKGGVVPQPRPAETDYLIGAYYYPGWDRTDAWDPLKRFFPERKPLLGWHHVGDPEVVDWQIKWAVEHGVRFFVYDWYWAKGHQRLEQGLHSGLFNARYQNLIKFCLLYANHTPFNPESSYSPEEFEKITQFWIANYFKRRSYLTVAGKPVIIMFSPPQARNVGPEKVRATFERMRQMCREAGFAGLYLCGASPFPVQDRMPAYQKSLELLKDEGYDAVTAYGWGGHINMTPAELATHRSPFAACAAGYRKAWNDIADAKVLKLIPPLSGGWDCRPWAGDNAVARTDRTPDQFKQHLLDCRQFLDAREQTPKLKMAVLCAWNEWTEGSYIEPDQTFRFGYLEAIRQVFAPRSPKPAEVVPADVGLGPYDLPDPPAATAWDFRHASTTLGWGSYLGRVCVSDGALRFKTRTFGPVPTSSAVQAAAEKYPYFVIRAAASQDIPARLAWGSPRTGLPSYKILGRPVRQDTPVPFVDFQIKAAREPQEIKIRLAGNPLWRDTITVLQFAAGTESGKFEGVDISIESMRLSEQ